MAEAATKLAVKIEDKKLETDRSVAAAQPSPFANLRREIDRLFDDFQLGPWRTPFRRSLFGSEPFWRGDFAWGKMPAVDIADTEKGYQVTAELPGIDEKNIEVTGRRRTLTIKAKRWMSGKRSGRTTICPNGAMARSQRSLTVPDGVDADKVEASFKNGVLTVTVPKTAEAQRREKKIEIKAASSGVWLQLPGQPGGRGGYGA